MSTLEVKIPVLVLKQVSEIAAKEKVSADHIVCIAVAAHCQTKVCFFEKALDFCWLMRYFGFVVVGGVRGLQRAWRFLTGSAPIN
jgi:hypothetical protein